MTLVYTFTSQFTQLLHPGKDIDKIITTYVNYYRRSIKSALKLGYKVELYISSDLVYNFKDLRIQVHTFDNIKSGLFDFHKAILLRERKDNFMLVDGDIDFHKKIPISEQDLIFDDRCVLKSNSIYSDVKAEKTWVHYYKPYIENLDLLNIKSVIPEWTGKRLNFVHNIGVLYFNNKKLKELYVDRWFKFNLFVNNKIDNPIPYTVIGAQYLLSEIVNHHSFTSEIVPQECYTHNLGKEKFTHPTVPATKLDKDEPKSFL